jgi:pimeloyl-ACP methyl ester carboxylesterase
MGRRLYIATTAAVAALTVFWSTAAKARADDGPSVRSTTCTEAQFDVTGGRVAGSLCGKDPANRHLLLITAHGATYNRLYWDWPQNERSLSFVERQPASVSVLNLDLLGSGSSSHPSSVTLTLQAQAAAVHQVVRAMRARGFEKIVLLGHSSGSGVATQEASTYHDVDGLIVTGFLHRFATSPPPGALAVPLALYPATLDPAFAKMSLDPGYLTTRPGARGNSGFYNTAVADPSVIAYDNAHKDVVSVAHVTGFGALVNEPSVSRAINVPVLSIVGSFDGGFCDAPNCPQAGAEHKAWSAAAQLEVHVIPNAGHDIHLHGAPYADAEFGYIDEWLTRRFEPSQSVAAVAAAPNAQVAPLLASHTTVAGYPFFGRQGPADLHVVLIAEVSPLVVGLVTGANVTFNLGLPNSETLTLTMPVGPCVSPIFHCWVSTDFHSDVDCNPADTGISVTATFSGEAPISAPSTSDASWISRCPTETL